MPKIIECYSQIFSRVYADWYKCESFRNLKTTVFVPEWYKQRINRRISHSQNMVRKHTFKQSHCILLFGSLWEWYGSCILLSVRLWFCKGFKLRYMFCVCEEHESSCIREGKKPSNESFWGMIIVKKCTKWKINGCLQTWIVSKTHQ